MDIRYSEDQQEMTASGNAELIHPDFKIYADHIRYNKKKHTITGTNNIEMVRQNQIILSDTFSYHTKTNDMSINNLDMELTTSKKQHQVYVSAKTFIDKGTIKKRGNGKNHNMQLRPTPLSF